VTEVQERTATPVDARLFRDVLGHYPTGVVLVTAISRSGEPIGMIVGSFTSVSLDPPLVAYLPTTTSKSYAVLREVDTFCINVLSADQELLCRRFASPGDDKWAGVGWTPSPGGAPVLEDAVAWIECTTESEIEAGDHYIVLGRVRELGVQNPMAPLLFFQGGYGRFTMSSVVAASTPDLIHAIQSAEKARDEIEALAARTGVAVDVVAAAGQDLVFVGAATGADTPPSVPTLGTRIPLMAPLGEQYVAWAGEAAAEAWIRRAGVSDPEAAERLRDRLRLARERGWSLSRLHPDDELDFYQTLRDYSDGEIVPAKERALRDRIVAYIENYDPVPIDPEGEYAAHSIVVPVLGRTNRPLLNIRLVNLPGPASGEQVLTWVQELRRCAAAVASRLADDHSPRSQRLGHGVASPGWG
jgi:flavin reductase (DIM6/NTAB) family NADH-FMN oxidoreductase RutF/DNA-binding IclR family transcriptional regulator